MNTETYIPIKDIGVGRYHQVFLVDNVNFSESMVTASGKSFAKITIKDVTGEMTGVVWGADNFVFVRGRYYLLKIDVKVYKESLSFTVDAENVTEVNTPLNLHDYIKGVSEASLVACAAEVEEAFEAMSDEHYRNVVGNAIHRLDLLHALKTSPYGLSGPLAYRGGLLVHVAGALRLAKVMAAQAKESETPLNVSLVMAACIFRNIGWHTSTTFTGGYLRPKDAFYMTGTSRASARYVDHLMIHVENDLDMKVPEAKKQALENACNDVADIKTIEGRIAASADAMMDLLHFGGDALRRKARGNWTDELFTGHNS